MSSATVPGDCHPRGRRDRAASGGERGPEAGHLRKRRERPRGLFPAGPGDPKEKRGDRPVRTTGMRRPPATTPRPASPTRRAPYLTPPLLAFVRGPAALVDAAPAEPAARVARPPRWHPERPHGRPPRARSHCTPPPPPTRPARRAGERDAAKEEEEEEAEEAGAARSRRSGTGGTHHSAARRSGTRAGAPQRAAASGTHQPGGRLGDPRLHPEDARRERMELPGRRAVGVAPRDQEEAEARAPCRPRAPPGRCLETDSSPWPGKGVALAGTDRALLGVHTPWVDVEREK